MYDFLKKLFAEGALTFDQFVAALDADKTIKLANLADGGYVAKEKHDNKVRELTTELTGVKEQLTAANTTIQSYKDMDIEGIKQSAADWEKKHKEDTEALTKKLEEQATEFAARTYLGGFQYSDDLVREAVYSKFMAKGFKRTDDGKFEGADAFMDELKKAYPSSFGTPPAQDPAGDPPAGDSGGNGATGNPHNNPNNSGNNRPWFAPAKQPSFAGEKKRTLSEMMAYKNAHPEAKVEFE